MFTDLHQFKTAVANNQVRQIVLVEQKDVQSYSLVQGERCNAQVENDLLVLASGGVSDQFDLAGAEVRFRGHTMKVSNQSGDYVFVVNPTL